MESKGFLIGFFSGLIKILQDVRMHTFKWYIALTDVFASTIVGYSVYSWSSESDSLEKWQVISMTVMLSLNAFFLLR